MNRHENDWLALGVGQVYEFNMAQNPLYISGNGAADDDLGWLAFRYIANEMPADDADAFETRLEHDQAAREAVAAAVELASAVAALPPETIPLPACESPRRRHWAQPAAWMSLGAAACLVGMIALQNTPLGAKLARLITNRMNSKLTSESGDAVATLWSMFKPLDQHGDDTDSPDAREMLAATDADSDDNTDVPGWMLAAIGGEPMTTPDDAAEPRGDEDRRID